MKIAMENTQIANTAQTVKDALDADPEIRLVIEIAQRARGLKSIEPPISIGMATDTATIAINSQCLVSLVIPG